MQILKVAKTASVVIALFSFIVAPLLQFAPDGLWQIIRIFTGFYNIPVIAIVIVGLFSTRVPALGPKIVIGFHLITCKRNMVGLLAHPAGVPAALRVQTPDHLVLQVVHDDLVGAVGTAHQVLKTSSRQLLRLAVHHQL